MSVKKSIDTLGREICFCETDHYGDLVDSYNVVKDAVTWKEFSLDDLGERYDYALPDNGEEILTYDVSGYIRMDVFCDGGEDGYYLASGYELCEDVTHWMKLPEVPDNGES